MKFNNFSYRTQIFLASSLSALILTTLIGGAVASRNAASIVSDYNSSMETIISQANLTLDTLLSDATKIADLPLLSQDLKKSMITNYGTNYLAYSQASTKFKNQFSQANRLNQNLVSCIFQNRYGYTFEYNITSVEQQSRIMKNIKDWREIAGASPNYTYFGSLQHATVGSQKNVLPMIKILFDGYDFKELGICYTEINFQSVETIVASARNTENTIFIYNADGDLTYSSDPRYLEKPQEYTALLSALSGFSASITDSPAVLTKTLRPDRQTFLVNGCYNRTTGWRLVQFTDNRLIRDIYRNNFFSYFGIIILSLLLGLLLALILSDKLTNSIGRLCQEIDSCPTPGSSSISMEACGSNQELCKLVTSFNKLNLRLADSLQQNYRIRLDEQQMHIQMLQFQINHHFLYNTLNVIKSLANLHNVPEIETIAVCISDLIRYNLTRFPLALLKEEIAQINRYMTIQNIRFPDKFQFDCHIPDQFQNLEIPAFILQPLVENCIEHGFCAKESNCCISISCSLEHHILHLFVADNGCGMSADILSTLLKTLSEGAKNGASHHYIGLCNVHKRLIGCYGENYGLSIDSVEGEGTIVDISLPWAP